MSQKIDARVCVLFADVVNEYCDTELFAPRCQDGEVILMTAARYGRMKLARCVLFFDGGSPRIPLCCSGKASEHSPSHDTPYDSSEPRMTHPWDPCRGILSLLPVYSLPAVDLESVAQRSGLSAQFTQDVACAVWTLLHVLTAIICIGLLQWAPYPV